MTGANWDTIGSFGFDSDLGMADVQLMDATDIAVPSPFPHDPGATFRSGRP